MFTTSFFPKSRFSPLAAIKNSKPHITILFFLDAFIRYIFLPHHPVIFSAKISILSSNHSDLTHLKISSNKAFEKSLLVEIKNIFSPSS